MDHSQHVNQSLDEALQVRPWIFKSCRHEGDNGNPEDDNGHGTHCAAGLAFCETDWTSCKIHIAFFL